MKGGNIEDEACAYLVQKGCEIIRRNYRIRGGEIDIIARAGATTVFIEVKGRADSSFGYPEEYVTRTKKKRIHAAVRRFLYENPAYAGSLRFDVFSKCGDKVTYYENVSLF